MMATIETILSLACLLAAVVALSFRAEAASQQPANTRQFDKWFALGSGCKAREDLPGDVMPVNAEQLKNPPNDPGRAEFGLLLPAFKLAPQGNAARGIARECAIRVHLNSPTGYRLSRLRARLKLDVTKPLPGDLFLHQELKLGTETIDIKQVRLMNQALTDRAINIDLDSTQATENNLAKLECGAKKIAGVDLTWIYKNREVEGKPEGVNVEMGGDKTVMLEGQWTKCAPDAPRT
ncbi:MAG: hypothetical protein RIQ81_2747 [Pseudomonadota bacterium]|jgi:hypothetical protein